MILADKLQGKTPLQRLRWLYRAVELIRVQHNSKGDDFKNGVITESEYKDYVSTFMRRQKTLLHAINTIKENQGLFLEENKDTAQAIKANGVEASDLDVDIEVDVIEP